MRRILIVGGVAGGATAAARLRRLDESAEIIMFERGAHISFANCGLPYHIGEAIPHREALVLQTPESFRTRFRVDVRSHSEVLSIDRDAMTVSVRNKRTGETYIERYDTLLLSPGGTPIKLPIERLHSEGVFTLRDLSDLGRIKDFMVNTRPRSAAVVGCGFIGLEMAENLVEAGLSVNVVELSDQVLAPLDVEMACQVHHCLRRNGVTVHLGSGVNTIDRRGGGLTLQLTNGATLKTDLLILAIGVTPESQLAKAAGLKTNRRGGIVVDPHMRTSDPHIFAVGDAVEQIDLVTGLPAMVPLAGAANKQARTAADNICGIPSSYIGTQASAIVKVFNMTAATTGVNEKTARRLLLNFDKVFLWLPDHAGYYPGARTMSMKVIFERDSGKILGAQIVGYVGVDKRCDVLATAIRAGMTARDLTRLELCYAPPYSSAKDPVNMAGYVIENVLKGKVKNFHWSDVDDLPRDGSLTLLDVRDPQEVLDGGIVGFANIPLDSLRDRLGDLDSSKPVYVCCQSGARSYIAARILMQHGFEVYNLSGGYRLYSSVSSLSALPDSVTAP